MHWTLTFSSSSHRLLMMILMLVVFLFKLSLLRLHITSAINYLLFAGAMLGMNMAVNSLIRTVSPTVGGIMLSTYGFPSIGYLGFINSVLVTIYVLLQQWFVLGSIICAIFSIVAFYFVCPKSCNSFKSYSRFRM